GVRVTERAASAGSPTHRSGSIATTSARRALRADSDWCTDVLAWESLRHFSPTSDLVLPPTCGGGHEHLGLPIAACDALLARPSGSRRAEDTSPHGPETGGTSPAIRAGSKGRLS